MLKIDLKLLFRDKIVLYMALGPLLLALVMMAVMGGASGVAMNYSAAPGVPQNILKNLNNMADVRVYESYEKMRDRVERADSVAGVYMEDGRPALLLEGNESEEFRINSSLLLSRAVAGDLPEFKNLPVQSAGSVITEIAFAMILLLSIFLGGSVAGFNMVAERESGAIRALAVSPLTLSGYLIARTALALLLSLVNVALCSLILGKGRQMMPLMLATLASAPICGLVALALGGTSSNQIAATGSLKLLMPACMIIPISSVFVPEGVKFLYWWIPVFWQYEALTGGLAGQPDLIAYAFVFLTGLIWLAVLSKLTARKLSLRYNKGGI
jgi:hypothetical protein